MRNFMELLRAKWAEGKFVCVGLDSDVSKIPSGNIPGAESMLPGSMQSEFNRRIVDATKDLVVAYKPNSAFYEDVGHEGWFALRDTVRYIHEVAPEVPVILDYKRADIGNTNLGYITSAFEYFYADAVTVNPYLGQEALQPFLDIKDKGIVVLCRTSNPGAGEFQNLPVHISNEELTFLTSRSAGVKFSFSLDKCSNTYFYNHVAYRVSQHWNANGNCAVVVGATYPQELAEIRAIVGDMPILIPGVGKQGGDLEAAVRAGRDSKGERIIVNEARSVIFASSGPDFADAARKRVHETNNLINQYRKVG